MSHSTYSSQELKPYPYGNSTTNTQSPPNNRRLNRSGRGKASKSKQGELFGSLTDDPIVALSLKNHLLLAVPVPEQLAIGDEPRYCLQLVYRIPAQFTLTEAQAIVQATDDWSFDPDTLGNLALAVNEAIAQSAKEVEG